jgi:hypothetical protein
MRINGTGYFMQGQSEMTTIPSPWFLRQLKFATPAHHDNKRLQRRPVGFVRGTRSARDHAGIAEK